ncbi:hypothetical protein O181_045690 [Austropuccinia psidii MF-1]|uniref:Cytochrome c oxidase subunit 8, mitochondrial n=1 Tax=Austropuccinia psidii MF-1 TaxID=1389203 RepID=A0A9Q3HLF8_9BASI|nr:hypothetical protein [Austropuccinia psidii MF-1]
MRISDSPGLGCGPPISPRATVSARMSNVSNQVRLMHIENAVGNNLPFKYRGEGQTKRKVAMKVGSFFVIGFFTPFAIARYQMKKSGAWP